jgi:PAS domain S-box-containing protein
MSKVQIDVEEMFERIDYAFFAVDGEWRFTFLNERAAELLDVDREAVVGEVVWDEFEAAVDTTFQAEYERAMETQEPVSFVEYYPPLERWFEVNAYPSETGLFVYFQDVTGRRQRERELERYEAIVETAQDGIYVVDDEGTFTMVNDAYCEMTGYDREELLGADVTAVVDESVADAASVLERELTDEERETPTIQASLERKDGETIAAEATFAMLPDGDRIGVVRDVTERRERERELGRTRELLEHTERIAEVGGWEIDAQTETVFWTDHLFDLLGLEADEEPSLEGALDVYLESDRHRVEQAVESALETGERFDVEARFETASGEVRWLRVQGEPEIKDGEVVSLRGGAQDITDRKVRDEQLELYRRVVETVDDGVYALDEEGNFILVNEAFCEMTGYDEEELLGAPVGNLYDDDALPPDVRQQVEAVRAGERQAATIEIQFESKPGETFPVEVRFETLPFDAGDGRCGVVRDVSERRKRERDLRRRVEQQAVVTRLGKRALGDPPLDELMAEAARLVSEALEADFCKVLDLDEEGEELLLRQGIGWRDGLVGTETVSAHADDSQAAYTLSTNEPVVVADLETETRFSGPDLLTSHGVASGISTVIGPEDDPWGILGVHDTDERTFTEQDVNFIQSVANVLGTAIRRYQDEQELRARHERLSALNDINALVHQLSESLFDLSSKTAIEELVCERLAESESYEFAWVGEAVDGEVAVSTESGVTDYLSDLTLALEDPPARRGPTAEAHLSGEMQVIQNVHEDPRYEPYRDHAREKGYRASAAVPIVDGGEQYGSLNVYSNRGDAFSDEERVALGRLGSIVAYAIRAVERDSQLQRERDRVEFMNRLLRHNLLNSLNVVEARLDLLEGRVDYEVSSHLETATERTAGMIDFVQTVREVTKVIGHGDEQELKPVDLGDTVSARVDRARTCYPEAEFHLEEEPSVDVIADDLVGEVLDNVLVNAIQHNDTDSPTVWIDTHVTDDAAVVSVADDGAGIPDDRKSDIFEREVTNFDDPGSGFGLYLVAEILDSYGGDITVADSKAGGARFELTFPRA